MVAAGGWRLAYQRWYGWRLRRRPSRGGLASGRQKPGAMWLSARRRGGSISGAAHLSLQRGLSGDHLAAGRKHLMAQYLGWLASRRKLGPGESVCRRPGGECRLSTQPAGQRSEKRWRRRHLKQSAQHQLLASAVAASQRQRQHRRSRGSGIWRKRLSLSAFSGIASAGAGSGVAAAAAGAVGGRLAAAAAAWRQRQPYQPGISWRQWRLYHVAAMWLASAQPAASSYCGAIAHVAEEMAAKKSA